MAVPHHRYPPQHGRLTDSLPCIDVGCVHGVVRYTRVRPVISAATKHKTLLPRHLCICKSSIYYPSDRQTAAVTGYAYSQCIRFGCVAQRDGALVLRKCINKQLCKLLNYCRWRTMWVLWIRKLRNTRDVLTDKSYII